MEIATAQADLRRAYVGGGPGAVVSALVWFAAAFVAARQGIAPAFTTLFFGGFLIYPVSTAICRLALGRPKESGDNPLGMTALESTIMMIGGLLAAWLFLSAKPAYVFPLAAVAVGTHYLVFKTAYGDWMFWILGAVITAVGLAGIFGPLRDAVVLAAAVGVIELVFGGVLAARAVATVRSA